MDQLIDVPRRSATVDINSGDRFMQLWQAKFSGDPKRSDPSDHNTQSSSVQSFEFPFSQFWDDQHVVTGPSNSTTNAVPHMNSNGTSYPTSGFNYDPADVERLLLDMTQAQVLPDYVVPPLSVESTAKNLYNGSVPLAPQHAPHSPRMPLTRSAGPDESHLTSAAPGSGHLTQRSKNNGDLNSYVSYPFNTSRPTPTGNNSADDACGPSTCNTPFNSASYRNSSHRNIVANNGHLQSECRELGLLPDASSVRIPGPSPAKAIQSRPPTHGTWAKEFLQEYKNAQFGLNLDGSGEPLGGRPQASPSRPNQSTLVIQSGVHPRVCLKMASERKSNDDIVSTRIAPVKKSPRYSSAALATTMKRICDPRETHRLQNQREAPQLRQESHKEIPRSSSRVPCAGPGCC